MSLFQNVKKSLLFNYTHSIVVFHTFLLLSLFLFKSCSNLRSKVVSYSSFKRCLSLFPSKDVSVHSKAGS